MRIIFFMLFTTVIVISCKVEPRSINFGHDDCEFCKMKLMDERFGAQLVTDKGRIYMFDDVNCMVEFMDSDEGKRHLYAYELIVDYSNPGELLDVHYTFFLKTDEIRTPMNSKIIALPNRETQEEFKADIGGILLGWGEIRANFK